MLVTTSDYINANKEAVRRLLAALHEAEKFTATRPMEALKDAKSGSGVAFQYDLNTFTLPDDA